MKAMEAYSPSDLYAASHRWTDEGFTVAEAVAEYMRMHPQAVEADVRAEIEKVAA